MTIPASQVQTVALSTLVEDPQNARSHDEKNLKAIKDSLSNYSQVEPLVVQRGTTAIGGNGRLRAMRELGLSEAAVVFVEVDDAKAKALGLMLNRSAELAAWNFTNLADILQEIDTGSFDVPALTGFDVSALERIATWTPGQAVSDPQAEWKGMPQFDQKDLTAYQSVVVHFKDRKDVEEFAKLVGQKITDETRSLWFPQAEIGHYADKKYVDEEKKP